MDITVLVGNPKSGSRTRRVAEELAARVRGADGPGATRTIDLAEHAASLFTWPDDAMAELAEAARACDLLVVASPTYKATFTGLLKAFLDRYPARGLAGTVALPVMTGADRTHAMAPGVHLAPLLTELGAVVPGAGLYFETPSLDRLDQVLDAWVETHGAEVELIRMAAGRRDLHGAGAL